MKSPLFCDLEDERGGGGKKIIMRTRCNKVQQGRDKYIEKKREKMREKRSHLANLYDAVTIVRT